MIFKMKKTIVIASGNAGKVREIRAALQPLEAELPSLHDLQIVQAAEPHATFIENALAKARAASAATSSAAIADDSGIVVAALNGAPGVHSARYGGEDASDEDNNRKLLAALQHTDNRQAFYYAAMVFVEHPTDPAPIFAEGYWRGEILRELRGVGGFGYDPLFFDVSCQKTGAEMSVEEKNAVSHRGKSLRELMRLFACRQ